ncbi:MAG: PEP-CTERM sorting domain-containing protein [Desulfobaccales bacterium]
MQLDLLGYRVYWDIQSYPYGNVIDVGNNTTCTLNGLPPALIYGAVTAYDVSGSESLFSNEVVFNNVPPPVPLPSSLVLIGFGLLGLAGWRRFRKG